MKEKRRRTSRLFVCEIAKKRERRNGEGIIAQKTKIKKFQKNYENLLKFLFRFRLACDNMHIKGT